jgi:hypothetical protein
VKLRELGLQIRVRTYQNHIRREKMLRSIAAAILLFHPPKNECSATGIFRAHFDAKIIHITDVLPFYFPSSTRCKA